MDYKELAIRFIREKQQELESGRLKLSVMNETNTLNMALVRYEDCLSRMERSLLLKLEKAIYEDDPYAIERLSDCLQRIH